MTLIAKAFGQDWRRSLRRDGYARFPNLCPAPLVTAARVAIDQDLATNYDPKRQVEYDYKSYCPALQRSPVLLALLTESGIAAKLHQAIGLDQLTLCFNVAQIALRRAGNAPRPSPPEPHIDGLPTPLNGVPSDVLVRNFSVLVGVFLSPVRGEFAGNFTVWPGSHHRLEQYFRECGLETLRNGMPDIPLGAPIQLMVEAGDVVLCHYQLAHAVAVNLSTADRYAVYFRLELADIDQRRWELMTDIWQGWRI
jgi:phytanoyl-CoA dioxygenase PhyH